MDKKEEKKVSLSQTREETTKNENKMCLFRNRGGQGPGRSIKCVSDANEGVNGQASTINCVSDANKGFNGQAGTKNCVSDAIEGFNGHTTTITRVSDANEGATAQATTKNGSLAQTRGSKSKRHHKKSQ